ncbi:MAG: hypothetical protein JSS83_23605 [Cyanobacteria bacterium SZAS LIN-3]|nr:hypothetical protein [Cyanobacteria bacterium SZAS LIN-3]
MSLTRSDAAPGGDERAISFPDDKSYGFIYVLQPTWVPYHLGAGVTNERYQARGVLNIDRSKKLALVANANLGERMDLLKKLAPDTLAKLDLSRLPVTGKDMSNISHLTSLQMLDLDQTDCDDNGLKFIKPLKNLEGICLSRALVTGATMTEIGNLPQLKRLHIGHTDLVPQSLSVMGKMKALKFLHVGCTKLKDEDLDAFLPLNGLIDLGLEGNKGITDRGIAKLKAFKNLTYLNLSDTKVTENGVMQLKGLPLTTLKLLNTAVTQLSLPRLKKAFPGCSIELSRKELPAEVFAPLH